MPISDDKTVATTAEIAKIVDLYLKQFPGERQRLAILLGQIDKGDTLNNRMQLPGHVTGSAIVLSPDKTEILLIYHNFLKQWLQPGGHWDPGEANPWSAAAREVVEETSVRIKSQLRWDNQALEIPIDIDSHPIPANEAKHEPAHIHHDFRYVFLADSTEVTHDITEVDAAKWFSLDSEEAECVLPVIHKLRSFGIIR